MMPLVSIVIPVYNVNRELLQSCLKSVLEQTYENIEIVIVNDGSKDDTLSFCQGLQEQHPQITVIDQENQGVSAARNNGTKAAKGEYIFYVDGDDLLSPIAVQEGVDCIRKYGADVVIAAIESIKSHEEYTYPRRFADRCKVLQKEELDKLRRHFVGLNDPEFMHINGSGYIMRGPICRLVKKEIALEDPFPGGLPLGEDLIWNMRLLNLCDSVCVVYNQWYGYLKMGGSAVRRYYGNRKEKVEEYLLLLKQENEAFYEKNKAIFGKNVATEFYCYLRYELLSEKCPLSTGKKIAAVRQMLRNEPWSILKEPGIVKSLPAKNKALLALCPSGLWIPAMKLLYKGD